MAETTQHLADIFDASDKSDTTAVFRYLHALRDRFFERLSGALRLREDMRAADIRDIKDPAGNLRGNMRTYTGDGSPVDWMIRSWIGNPDSGFSNLHLTTWLNDSIDVPHLGIALGTAPQVFCLIDLIPRYELSAVPAHLAKYYEALNDAHIMLRRETDYVQFTPYSAFIRATLSPVAICGLVPFEVFKAKVEPLMWTYLEHWLALVAAAAPVDPALRPALAQHDLTYRRNVAELDPANVFADRMLGVPMRERLVRILWGGEREAR